MHRSCVFHFFFFLGGLITTIAFTCRQMNKGIIVALWWRTYLPSSSAQTTLEQAHAIETALTESPPDVPRDARLSGGCPHAKASKVSFEADRISARRVVSTASIGTAGDPFVPPRFTANSLCEEPMSTGGMRAGGGGGGVNLPVVSIR